MRLSLGFPDRAAEAAMLAGQRAPLDSLDGLLSPQHLLAAQAAAAALPANDALIAYVLDLLAAARAWAWLVGAAFVTPAHVQAVFAAVAEHRLDAGRPDQQCEPLSATLLSQVDAVRCPRQHLRRRLRRREPVLQLQRRNLYILPTGFGGLWLGVSGVLYVVGINSRSNGPVLLSHLLLALALLSLFLTHRNLEGLGLKTLEPHASCADETALVPLLCSSRSARAAVSFCWLSPASDTGVLELPLQPGRTRVDLPWRPPGRGLLQALRRCRSSAKA